MTPFQNNKTISPNSIPSSPYLHFNKNTWADLRANVPMTLQESDLLAVKGINDNLSLDEVAKIYLPLARLLNLYISSNIRRQTIIEEFIGKQTHKIPYIIGIAGSVAVGKSTTARLLQTLLSEWPEHRHVELLTTDGFLHPNKVLKQRNIMHKKGFPESYDMKGLVQFVSDIKSGKTEVSAPLYSHLIYDIVPNQRKIIKCPDILIIEGLNVLQSGMDYPHELHRVFVSDFVDFSIYVDAEEEFLKQWYIERFLKFRMGAFSDPNSYFHDYAKLPEAEAITIASSVWDNVNAINLNNNILPTKERANLILKKGNNHEIEQVKIRK
ncbi:type I pantothenate kinase [Thorsellia anophelis]|uniref:Pantothenate kinase n=1 Tax=Thorsellia anophelis DSM 18579 TaxID=1123402 RepID=A0A1I0F4G8_9GAMM|nr:type I pantothenate kinase [Thorsellia anophelis]SET52305.1 pantothenate kinase [Thorsellia anophelis DSM 18579]